MIQKFNEPLNRFKQSVYVQDCTCNTNAHTRRMHVNFTYTCVHRVQTTFNFKSIQHTGSSQKLHLWIVISIYCISLLSKESEYHNFNKIVNAEHIKLLVNLENWNIFKFCYQYNWSVTIATFFEVHMVHLLRLSFDLFHLIPSVKNLIWAKYFGQNIYISQNCLKKYTYKLRSSIFLLYQSLVIILW